MHHGEYEWNHDFPRIAREAGFKFCEFHNENIDWKFIGSLDIEKIIREREFDRLDHAIPYISQAPLDELLNSRILDPAISKYFGFAQLSVQYLLFCKQFLDQTVSGIRSATFESQKENSRLQRILKRRNDELLHLQKKQQQKQIVYSCTKCTKNFISNELLNRHISNKHSEDLNYEKATVINTNQLEIEIKQLKERLNIAEKELIDQKQKEVKCDGCDNKSKKVQSIGIQSNLEEAKDEDESEEKIDPSEVNKNDLTDLLKSQMVMFEEWKCSERKIYTDEISGLKKKFEETIEDFKSNSKVVLEKCVEANLVISPRQQDDVQIEMDFLKRDQEEIVWKKRFNELEEMYENNQKKMNNTIRDLDDKYKDNMMKIEETVRKESLQRAERFEEEIRKISIKHLEPEVKVITSQVEAKTSNILKAKIGLLGRSTTIIDQQSSCTDSETEYSSDDESQGKKYESKIKPVNSVPLKIAPKKLVKMSQADVKEVPIEDPKNVVKKLIKNRFGIFGVTNSVKNLQSTDMEKVTKKLALKREISLKKFKTFFITRNQLSSKMDKLANEKIDKKDTNKILSVEIKKPKIFPPSVTKSKPIAFKEETKINPNDFLIETIIEKPERDDSSQQKIPIAYQQVVDIESEVNTLLSNLNRKKSPEIETSTPIKDSFSREFTVNHNTINNLNDGDFSEISEIQSEDFILKKQPQPVPRKRVLFDLEKNRIENDTKVNETLKEEEASDFDISSFNSDK